MSYEQIPYESAPFTETHPEHLAAHARLFGLEPADPRRCRVLEIGCASGGNLIPMAFHLPESNFVGVDLSPSQVAAGQALIERVGISNVELRAGDIADFTDEAPFDYIVAHGIYSWAPAAVREKILTLCSSLLSPHGVAYISYNTLPGWRMRGTLRDMLLHHTRDLHNPGERLAAARAFLDELEAALGDIETSHSDFLRGEIGRIRRNHESYLFHEYLAEINQPFLFTEFVGDCARHGLDYLCDTQLRTLFPQTLGDRAEAMITQLPDPIEQWQYMDFLINRNFRQSLVCRTDACPRREPDLWRFAQLALFSTLAPPKKVDLHKVKAAPFHTPDGESFGVHHPLTRAVLVELHAAYPGSVEFAALAARAERQVAGAGERLLAGQTDHLLSELFGLYASGAIGATPYAQPRSQLSGAVRANALAGAQAALGLGHAAGRRHTVVQLDPFARALIAALAEERDRETLVDTLCSAMISNPELRSIAADVEPARLRRMVEANSVRVLELFGRHGLLEGDVRTAGREGE